MHYRKIWEKHNNRRIPDGCEIHHIDGDRHNNAPQNLLCVTKEEHLSIHRHQQDWGAVHAILARMEIREGIAEAASKAQKKRLVENKHNFQRITSKQRSLISKETMKQRKEKFGVAFLGILDVKENARRGGKAAALKKAGFLNTNSPKHGSKHVKGTCWWTNTETGEKIRSLTPPNEQWKRGMKSE